jgi:DNA-binding GntR family transcriptional regulator
MVKGNFIKIEGYELLSHKIYCMIKNLIVENNLIAVSELKEEKIASQLGISRTPVREVFKRLSSEGFIKSFPNRKAVVRSFSILNICKFSSSTSLSYIRGPSSSLSYTKFRTK